MIKAQTKRLVRSRYVMRCGYCGVSEQDVGATLTLAHYQPHSAKGTNGPDNFVALMSKFLEPAYINLYCLNHLNLDTKA